MLDGGAVAVPVVPTRGWRRELALQAGLAAAYFAAGKLALLLAVVHVSVTAVWPPTGIALAAVLVYGTRVWPALLLGAFMVNVTTAGGLLPSLGIAAGNTLEALAGGLLVERFARGQAAFERPADILRFALLGGLAAPAVSATIGVASLRLGGLTRGAPAAGMWLTWWLGDAGGA
ncbi:MAG: MASE1 domain-containing protein, partial [Elusimicrobia bacterium]|nr:MASE1 domain-containing protein [Elusimicrobiota bacterium]